MRIKYSHVQQPNESKDIAMNQRTKGPDEISEVAIM